jgi:hypothetical protein
MAGGNQRGALLFMPFIRGYPRQFERFAQLSELSVCLGAICGSQIRLWLIFFASAIAQTYPWLATVDLTCEKGRFI